MTATFTGVELRLLTCRLTNAVAGLAREMDYRRHPLTGSLARDQRFSDDELTRLYLCYRQLARLAQTLARPVAPVDNQRPVQLSHELLVVLANELELTYAAVRYINHTPFSRPLRRKLLRALAVEARFFRLVLAVAGQEPGLPGSDPNLYSLSPGAVEIFQPHRP